MSKNRIIKVEIEVDADGVSWYVSVTKEFAPAHGGGTQVFKLHGGENINTALTVARAAVDVSGLTDRPLEVR